MRWRKSHRFDSAALPLADRHYNRQKPGSPQFAPPGWCVVLLAPQVGPAKALWVSSRQDYVRHAWPGAWVCSCFRNEGAGLSSELIREAVSATLAIWGPLPEEGMVTFVDPGKVRHKRDPGRCFLRAGFEPAGHTQGGLVAFRLSSERVPGPEWPYDPSIPLFAGGMAPDDLP